MKRSREDMKEVKKLMESRNNRHAKKKPLRKKGRLKAYLRSPKALLLLILVGILIINAFFQPIHQEWMQIVYPAGTGVLLEILIMALLKRKFKFPDGGLLTAVIIALVMSRFFPIYLTVITTYIAILSKHIVKVKRMPVFNPAALGLLLSVPLFSSLQSWWGAMSLLPAWMIVYLFAAGLILAKRIHKLPQVFSFLGVYFSILLLMQMAGMNQAFSALYRTPLINSTLFLAFFMLTDPPTSPGKPRKQVIFGAVAASVSLLYYFKTGGQAYLLVGLLTANAWNGILLAMRSKKKAKHQNRVKPISMN